MPSVQQERGAHPVEPHVAGDLVAAVHDDRQHGDVQFLETRRALFDLGHLDEARLAPSALVEVEHDVPAPALLQAYLLAVGIGQAEAGRQACGVGRLGPRRQQHGREDHNEDDGADCGRPATALTVGPVDGGGDAGLVGLPGASTIVIRAGRGAHGVVVMLYLLAGSCDTSVSGGGNAFGAVRVKIR